jgi:DNA repair exonuclease SbcCD ATPase subunit
MNLKVELQNMAYVVLAKMETQEKLLHEMNAKITNLTNPTIPKSPEPAITVQHVCDCAKTDQELENMRDEIEKLRHDLVSLHLALKTKKTELDEQKLDYDHQLSMLKAEIDPLILHATLVEEDWEKKVVALIRKAFDSNTTKLKPTTDNLQKVYRKLKRDIDSTGSDILQRNQYLIDMLEFCEDRFSKDINDYKVRMAGRAGFDREYFNLDSELGFVYVKFVVALLTLRLNINDDYIPTEEFWSNW